MNKEKIKEVLMQAPGLHEVEEIEYKSDFLVLRFFYNYDKDELEAAKEYANTESKADDGEDKWYDDYYIPYIIDIAVDEVRDTIEELVEDTGVNAEYISYEPDRDDDNCEFVAVFTDKDKEFDIDDVLESIGL